jgi:hypothetical protein
VSPFEYVRAPILKLLRNEDALLIVSVADTLAELKIVVPAWVAVIITVPACKIVTVDPDILAMFELELAYENAPVLVDNGCGMVNVQPLAKNVRTGILKLRLGPGLVITKFAVMLPDL